MGSRSAHRGILQTGSFFIQEVYFESVVPIGIQERRGPPGRATGGDGASAQTEPPFTPAWITSGCRGDIRRVHVRAFGRAAPEDIGGESGRGGRGGRAAGQGSVPLSPPAGKPAAVFDRAFRPVPREKSYPQILRTGHIRRRIPQVRQPCRECISRKRRRGIAAGMGRRFRYGVTGAPKSTGRSGAQAEPATSWRALPCGILQTPVHCRRVPFLRRAIRV